MARRPPTEDGEPPRRPLWVLALLGILLAAWVSLAPTAGAVESWPTTRFGEAAEWYQQREFPPPRLEPIVDTSHGAAVRGVSGSLSERQGSSRLIGTFTHERGNDS